MNEKVIEALNVIDSIIRNCNSYYYDLRYVIDNVEKDYKGYVRKLKIALDDKNKINTNIFIIKNAFSRDITGSYDIKIFENAVNIIEEYYSPYEIMGALANEI